MKMLYKVTLLCLLISLISAQNSGLKGRINLPGLQTILDSVRFAATKFPNLFVNLGEFSSINVKGTFTQKYLLQNVQAESLSFTEQSDVKLSEMIFTNFTLTNVTLTGQWVSVYLARGRILFKKIGNFEARVQNIKFVYGVLLKPLNGKFLFNVERCSIINDDDLSVKFTTFNADSDTKSSLENLLRFQIVKRICASYIQTQSALVSNLQPNPVMSLGGIADMDGSIEGNIDIDETGLVFNFAGRCFLPGHPEINYNYSSGNPPEFSFSNKSIQIVGDEYILQTFIATLHSRKLMGATISQKELPPMLAGMLSTDMISLAMDLPELQKYGKRPMRIRMDSTAPPDVKFNSDGTVSMVGIMDVNLMVETEEANQESVMSMTALVNGTNGMFAKNSRLYSNITDITMEMSTVSSTVGEVPSHKLHEMMHMMTPYVIKSLNELFSEGVEMPVLVSLKLVDLELEINQGSMELRGDVTLPLPIR